MGERKSSSAPVQCGDKRTRSALSREKIVGQAVDLIDATGVAELSMRKLGSALGFEAMALYRHYPNKAALLSGVAESLYREIISPDPSDPDWKAQVRAFAYSVRRAAQRHPRVFPLLVSAGHTHLAAEGILWALSAVLKAAGFDEQAAHRALLVLGGYVMGATMWEIAALSGGGEPISGLPKPSRLGQCRPRPLEGENRDELFQFGLEVLLDGLQARLNHKA